MSEKSIDPMPDAVAPGGLNHDTASALAAQQADKHRAAIRKFAAEKGLTIAQLGKRIGLMRIPTKSAVDSDRNQPPIPREASRGFRRSQPGGGAVCERGKLTY